jgi:ribosomal-protein-alanine N-acetyltransferase
MTDLHGYTGYWQLNTDRLMIRPAVALPDDIDFLYRLWTNHEVMRFVGFPQGLHTSREQIRAQLERYSGSPFDRVLLACLSEKNTPIGECKLGSADDKHIASTDLKLLPRFWGRGYGKEIKRALVDYLFTHTDCIGIRATPNKLNTPSIRMQEAVGGHPVGEGHHRFPDRMKAYTVEVHYIEYVVSRDTWEKLRA